MIKTVRDNKTAVTLDLAIRTLKPRVVASESSDSSASRDARVVVVTSW